MLWNMCVLEKYLQNIVRMGVEVSSGSKVPQMMDVQGYPRAKKTRPTFFLKDQTTIVLNNS